jgi:hypothetical protein
MKKQTLPAVLGAGFGFAIGWLIARAGDSDHERVMILKKRSDGKPGLEAPPEYVEIRKGKKLTWWIVNQTGMDVLVSLKKWRDLNDNYKDPAVIPQPDQTDSEDPQEGLSRLVRDGKVRKIRSRARAPENILLPEILKYDVYLNDELALDPIVKLVL